MVDAQTGHQLCRAPKAGRLQEPPSVALKETHTVPTVPAKPSAALFSKLWEYNIQSPRARGEGTELL